MSALILRPALPKTHQDQTSDDCPGHKGTMFQTNNNDNAIEACSKIIVMRATLQQYPNPEVRQFVNHCTHMNFVRVRSGEVTTTFPVHTLIGAS